MAQGEKMKTSRIVRGTVEGLGWGVLALIIVAIVTIFVDED
jgi:hypothetical protein